MKNLRMMMTAAMLLVSLAAGTAVAQTSTSKPAAGAPPAKAAPAGPQVQSPAEGAALRAIVMAMRNPATTPQAMDSLILNFNTKFPKSEFKETVATLGVEFFHGHGDYARTLEYGRNALRVDPDSLFILLTLGSDIPANVHSTDLDRDQRLAEATGYNNHAMKIAENMPDVFNGHPLSAAQKAAISQMVISSAHSNLGMIALDRKAYADAVKEYQTALPMDPPSAAAMDYYHLAMAQEGMKQYAAADTSLDKAISMGAANASLVEMAKLEKQKIARETAKK